MATARNDALTALAQRVADALPVALAEEVVLTGSVSRGMADEVSDIEMLVVTPAPLALEDCFELARAAGLEGLGTWGAPHELARRVSGHRERVPLELIWWPRDHAEARIGSSTARRACSRSSSRSTASGNRRRSASPCASRRSRSSRTASPSGERALAEPDPRRALRVMTDLRLDAVALAPSGPNVDRARGWLAGAAEVLRSD